MIGEENNKYEHTDNVSFNELVKHRCGVILPKELFTMIRPLFDEIALIHKAGSLHKNINPDNLVLENGEVRLLNYGCADEHSSENGASTNTVNQGYTPIEQYQESRMGPWTDVYALSATIYFCLTGIEPPKALDRTLEDELVPPSKLGVKIEEDQEKALLKGLAINPRSRYQSMEELYEGLYYPKEEHRNDEFCALYGPAPINREPHKETYTARLCPYCHNNWIDEDSYCRFCGHKHDKYREITREYDDFACVYGPMPVKRKHVCEKCGYSWETDVMIDHQNFCPKCGGEAIGREMLSKEKGKRRPKMEPKKIQLVKEEQEQEQKSKSVKLKERIKKIFGSK